MIETPEARLKRLRMRSWRRGTKEMDLILGPFADRRVAALPDAELALYELMLAENDQDLYGWITGRQPAPDVIAPMVALVAADAGVVPEG